MCGCFSRIGAFNEVNSLLYCALGDSAHHIICSVNNYLKRFINVSVQFVDICLSGSLGNDSFLWQAGLLLF